MVAMNILCDVHQLHLFTPTMINKEHTSKEAITLSALRVVLVQLQARYLVNRILYLQDNTLIAYDIRCKQNGLAGTNCKVIFDTSTGAFLPALHHIDAITIIQHLYVFA